MSADRSRDGDNQSIPTKHRSAPTGPAPEETQDRPGVDTSDDTRPTGHTPPPRTSAERRTLYVGLAAAAAAGAGHVAASQLEIGPLESAALTAALACLTSAASAWALFARASRASRRAHESFTRTLEKAVEPRRTVTFDALLAYEDDPELGRPARLIHKLLTSTHQHRLEAGWLRREMDTIADTKARERTEALRREAVTDPLTGLLNRRGFEQAVGELFRRAKQDRAETALLAIDLDNFKELNDTHGHAIGDEALVAAGEILRAHTRQNDVAARVGGDELFLVLFDTNVGETRAVAQRLAESFACHRKARPLGGDWPTMSIGVALALKDAAEDERELFRLADEALYASKRAGRSRATLYNETDQARDRKAA